MKTKATFGSINVNVAAKTEGGDQGSDTPAVPTFKALENQAAEAPYVVGYISNLPADADKANITCKAVNKDNSGKDEVSNGCTTADLKVNAVENDDANDGKKKALIGIKKEGLKNGTDTLTYTIQYTNQEKDVLTFSTKDITTKSVLSVVKADQVSGDNVELENGNSITFAAAASQQITLHLTTDKTLKAYKFQDTLQTIDLKALKLATTGAVTSDAASVTAKASKDKSQFTAANLDACNNTEECFVQLTFDGSSGNIDSGKKLTVKTSDVTGFNPAATSKEIALKKAGA